MCVIDVACLVQSGTRTNKSCEGLLFARIDAGRA